MRRIVVIALLVAGCSGGAAETTTVVAPPTTAAAVSTTSTTEAATTTTVPEVVDLLPLEQGLTSDSELNRKLVSMTRYVMEIDGVSVEFAPPSDGWELFSYQPTGVMAGALFEWQGPSGFKEETLNLKIFDVGSDVDDAWARIDALGAEGEADHGVPWQPVAEGSAMVGGVEAEWREVRTPVIPPLQTPESGDVYRADYFLPDLWGNTSVRFYVVPVEQFTITVMAYESRCACTSRPSGLFDGDQIADDVENELADWLPELEAFLASLDFAES